MSTRVNIPQWIIKTVGISVEALRINRVLNNDIRTNKPPQRCIIIPGVVEVKARFIEPLAGEHLGKQFIACGLLIHKRLLGVAVAAGDVPDSAVSIRFREDGIGGGHIDN